MQRAKGPFMGITLLATAAIASWQSNRMYRQRQQALLDEFGATMVFHLGDTQELSATIQQFRRQLGPGSFRGAMFQSYVTSLATDVPIGVDAIKYLQQVAKMMKLTDSAAGACLEGAAAALSSQPSVLGKLTFIAERALPMAASMAKLRSRFPNWSLDTVTALQRAMLENLYRDTYCDGSLTADSATLEVLGLSETDAARLMQEVQEKKAEAERVAAQKAAEAERAQQLEEALARASEMKQMRTISTASPSADEDEDEPSEPSVTGAAGTHEYECTKCGYILFPAAGRESKFFGAGFTCPQCGATKDEFVDNGPVDNDPVGNDPVAA